MSEGFEYSEFCDEVKILDRALDEATRIQSSLQSSMNHILELTAKHGATSTGSFLVKFTPGSHKIITQRNCKTEWTERHVLTCKIYNLIDEKCRKHNFNIPQKRRNHNVVQKINDDSTRSSSGVDIINHGLQSYQDFVGGEKSKNQIDIDIPLFRTRSELLRNYNQISIKTIKIRRELESTLLIIEKVSDREQHVYC